MNHTGNHRGAFAPRALSLAELENVAGGEDEYGGGGDYGGGSDYGGSSDYGASDAGGYSDYGASDAGAGYSDAGSSDSGYSGSNEMESANDAYGASDASSDYSGNNEMESANDAYGASDASNDYSGNNEMESANDAFNDPNASAEPTTQTFDDGSSLTTNPDGTTSATDAPADPQASTQTFDDGSTLTTNPDGSTSATPATDQAQPGGGITGPDVLDKVGSAVQAAGGVIDNSAIYGAAADVAKGAGADRAGNVLQGMSDRAAARTGFGPALGNIATGAAVRAGGAAIGLGADLWGNGKPQTWGEVGSMVVKNSLTGAAGALGGLGGSLAGPVGTVGGAVGASALADGPAGRFADWMFGTNRYSK